MNLLNTIRRSLGAQLILMIILIFILFGIIFMGINVFFSWQTTSEEFQKKMNYIADFAANSNSSNLSKFDYLNMQRFMVSLLNEKTLNAVIFETATRDEKTQLAQFYGMTDGNIIDKKAATIKTIHPASRGWSHYVQRQVFFQGEPVGKVHLFFSDKYISLEVVRQTKMFMINLTVFVVLFSGSIYYTLREQLLAPLKRIHQLAMSVSGFTTYLSQSVSQERWIYVQRLLTLEKSRQDSLKEKTRNDELGDFIQAFLLVLNGFEVVISELSQYSAQLKIMNNELEERINKRTAELEDSHEKISESLKALQKTQSQLIQQEKLASIGQLAAGVAHEINNPIGYVGSNINRMGEYFSDLRLVITEMEKALASLPEETATGIMVQVNSIKKRIDYDFLIEDFSAVIVDCREGITRVKEIVQSLKDFSHNVDEKDFSDININDVINTTLKVVNNEIKYHCDISLQLQLQEQVSANLGQMHQVLSNLLVNAAHAMRETGKRGQLSIRTWAVDEQAIIEIEDTGAGIPEAIHNKIFDPFFTTKPVGQGTGLGLNICYDIIVNKHKGELSFKSQPGLGTVFIIKLPLSHQDLIEV